MAAQHPWPITVDDAASRLGVSKGTIYSWVTRYGARRLGRVGRRTYYDYHDLAAIDGAIAAGVPVPHLDERVIGAA